MQIETIITSIHQGGWGGGCHIFIWKSLEESCNCKRRKSSCRQAVKEEFLSWDLLRRFMSAGAAAQ